MRRTVWLASTEEGDVIISTYVGDEPTEREVIEQCGKEFGPLADMPGEIEVFKVITDEVYREIMFTIDPEKQ